MDLEYADRPPSGGPLAQPGAGHRAQAARLPRPTSGRENRSDRRNSLTATAAERIADRGQNVLWFLADLTRREMEHQDPVGGHSAVPAHRPLPAFRRQVPLLRVDLHCDADIRPPG